MKNEELVIKYRNQFNGRESKYYIEMPGVYIIENKDKTKCYIGESYNVMNRIQEHILNLNNGNHVNKLMQITFDKLGCDELSFRILHLVDEETSLNIGVNKIGNYLLYLEAAYSKKYLELGYEFYNYRDPYTILCDNESILPNFNTLETPKSNMDYIRELIENNPENVDYTLDEKYISSKEKIKTNEIQKPSRISTDSENAFSPKRMIEEDNYVYKDGRTTPLMIWGKYMTRNKDMLKYYNNEEDDKLLYVILYDLNTNGNQIARDVVWNILNVMAMCFKDVNIKDKDYVWAINGNTHEKVDKPISENQPFLLSGQAVKDIYAFIDLPEIQDLLEFKYEDSLNIEYIKKVAKRYKNKLHTN